MVVHSYIPSTWEAKVGRSGVRGYRVLYSEFHPDQSEIHNEALSHKPKRLWSLCQL